MKKSVVYAIIAVLVIAVAGFAIYTYTASPSNTPIDNTPKTPTKVYTIKMREYSFIPVNNTFPLKIKSGEPFQIKLINEGVLPHELMLVKDKDKIVEIMHDVLNNLIDQGLENNLNDYMNIYKKMHENMITEYPDLIIGSWVLPLGDQINIDLKLDEPGTYWAVCLEMEGTMPRTHLQHNMFAEIDVGN